MLLTSQVLLKSLGMLYSTLDQSYRLLIREMYVQRILNFKVHMKKNWLMANIPTSLVTYHSQPLLVANTLLLHYTLTWLFGSCLIRID